MKNARERPVVVPNGQQTQETHKNGARIKTVRDQKLPNHPPATTTLQAALLPFDFDVVQFMVNV